MTKCAECQESAIQDYADLRIKFDRTMNYNKLLLQALDNKEELNKFLRIEIDELQTKLKVLKEAR